MFPTSTSFSGPVLPNLWPENTPDATLSLLIDSDSATCIDFLPEDLNVPVVVKVPTENFNGVKRLVVINGNLRDTMDPCNGMPFLVMTQTGAENISDTMCRPYCGRAVRCDLHNQGMQAALHQEQNTVTTVQTDCHCWSADGCNGIFLQISLTSLVNQQNPGKLCEISLSRETTTWIICFECYGITPTDTEKKEIL